MQRMGPINKLKIKRSKSFHYNSNELEERIKIVNKEIDRVLDYTRIDYEKLQIRFEI